MNANRWQTIKSLFLEAASLEPEQQEAFLKDLALADQELSRMLRDLLSESAGCGVDLQRPCWSVARVANHSRTFEAGRMLANRFEIVEFLGAGGWGEVYGAFDHQQQLPVALKTLHTTLAKDASAASILRKELNAARAVTHTNVCRLFDLHWAQEADTPPFFTMELLEGGTLADRLAIMGAYSVADARPLVEQILDGLEAVHRCGIIHRDFKSANVMLTNSDTRAVVMDFGLARDVTPGPDLQTTFATGGIAGTPAYMAPEILRGQRATFASDIHALGVVLFEMVTGRRPFEGESPLAVASRRLNEDAPSPRDYAPTLRRAWGFTIVRCLEQDPRSRPQSIAEVRQLLASRPPVLWMRRRMVLGGACAAAGVAAAGSIAFVGPVGIRRTVQGWFRSSPVDTAMDLYVRGNTLLQEGTAESVRDAIGQLERAVQVDTRFALASAALAEAYLVRRNFGFEPEAELNARARRYAENSVALDPDLAEGHAAMGAVYQSDWNWEASEQSYNRALRLKPSFARARRWRSGLVLQFSRFDQALADLKLAFDQDPYDRNAVPGYMMTLMFSGRFREAVEFGRERIGDRDMPAARHNLSQTYARLGQLTQGAESSRYFDLALAEAKVVAAIEHRMPNSNSELSTRVLALIHTLRGQAAEAEPYLQRLQKAEFAGKTSPGQLAIIYSCQRRVNEALDALDRAMEKRDGFLMYLRVHTFLENLWGLPRFEAMLRTIKLK